ncbi:GNAT family N-acetyltransferase [Evansella tamaricis]|uniref:GNAT family N-acetyltransferase n=1 Tax=Evansella tamaricis TaxID=2069301 RepID=A0ABS6JKD8_9BACI|nr:GNAT family N-acetyltransferase [Evansella tamaricis]MBU9714149.1 GNAT family N-acetyltransferase [Evansella tamaricis]
MLKIAIMKIEELENVAHFISEINKVDNLHIGYCGVDPLEIAHSIKEDISDIPYHKSFLTAYENDTIIAVLGFDADLEGNGAEIWGPFVKEDKRPLVFRMWSEMVDLLPNEIHSLNMFPNKKNSYVLQLAKNLNFNKHSEHTILEFHRDTRNGIKDGSSVELREEHFLAMELLHNEAFPDSYYSGQQIINRLNEYRKVFVIEKNDSLCGYIYVEAEPAHGEASIEFFAVKESERRKGFGVQLVSVALKWLLTIESIDSINLCVNSSNETAISLYKKVGFKQVHELCFFTKKM